MSTTDYYEGSARVSIADGPTLRAAGADGGGEHHAGAVDTSAVGVGDHGQGHFALLCVANGEI